MILRAVLPNKNLRDFYQTLDVSDEQVISGGALLKLLVFYKLEPFIVLKHLHKNFNCSAESL